MQQRLNPHVWYLKAWICLMVCHQVHPFLVSFVVDISKQCNYIMLMVTKPPDLSRTRKNSSPINNSFPEYNLEDHLWFQKAAWKPARDDNSCHFYKFDIVYLYRFYFSGRCSKGNILLLYSMFELSTGAINYPWYSMVFVLHTLVFITW